MSEFGRRFDPSELANGEPGGNGDAAAAELLVIARDLEAFARSESVTPSIDFEDRVMAAIADEPPPRPISSHGVAGLVALVRDSWRLAWSGNRPMAVRAQALAFVLLAAVALGSVVSLGAVGVGRLLSQAEPPPTVAPAPVPTPTPSPTPSMTPSPSVSPTPSPTPIGVSQPGDSGADGDRRTDRDRRRLVRPGFRRDATPDERLVRPGIRFGRRLVRSGLGFEQRLVRQGLRLERRDGSAD